MIKKNQAEKTVLHPRNRHRHRYDFEALVITEASLKSFIRTNEHGNEGIDFFDPLAVKCLNKALLKHHYQISSWDIPEGYLCPPIPGRADYIHHVADLLSYKNEKSGERIIPTGTRIKCLDIGVGASCIYPLIGSSTYGWWFVGTDIDAKALEAAKKNVANNPAIANNIQLRLQTKPSYIFKDLIDKREHFDLTICNPPFHSSKKEAEQGHLRKLSNLKNTRVSKAQLNFGGQANELWFDGGEQRFIHLMIVQSKLNAKACLWFTTLVSKQEHLSGIYKALKKVNALEVKTVELNTGNKKARFVAWTFASADKQKTWRQRYWKPKR